MTWKGEIKITPIIYPPHTRQEHQQQQTTRIRQKATTTFNNNQNLNATAQSSLRVDNKLTDALTSLLECFHPTQQPQSTINPEDEDKNRRQRILDTTLQEASTKFEIPKITTNELEDTNEVLLLGQYAGSINKGLLAILQIIQPDMENIDEPRKLLVETIGSAIAKADEVYTHYKLVNVDVTRKNAPPLLCTKPEIGLDDNIFNIKTNHLKVYSGSSGETIDDYITWTDTLFGALRGKTERAHVEMMHRLSSGKCQRAIKQKRRIYKDDLFKILQDIEESVVRVVPPDIAEKYLNTLRMQPNDTIQSISEVIDSFVDMMLINVDPRLREQKANEYGKKYLLNVIPSSLKQQFDIFEMTTIQTGKRSLTYKATIKQLIQMNRMNSANKQSNLRINNPPARVDKIDRKKYQHRYDSVNQIQLQPDLLKDNDDDERESVISDSLHRLDLVHWDNEEEDAKTDCEETSEIDEIDAIQRKRLSPASLGVSPNECLKCGFPDHRFRGPTSKSCRLRNKELAFSPCRLCRKGGHNPSDCPRKNA